MDGLPGNSSERPSLFGFRAARRAPAAALLFARKAAGILFSIFVSLLLTALFTLLIASLASLASAAEITQVAFSHDGRYLSAVDDTGSLFVTDIGSGRQALTLRNQVKGGEVAWRPGKPELAVALDLGQGWDIYLLKMDGSRKRLTDHPAQDCSPQWIDGGARLVFASSRGGCMGLYELDPDSLLLSPLGARSREVWCPSAQPGGSAVAYLTMEKGETQLWFSAVGREPASLGTVDALSQSREAPDVAWDSAGDLLLFVECEPLKEQPRMNLRGFDPLTNETKLLFTAPRISNPLGWSAAGSLFVRTDRDFLLFPQWRGRHTARLDTERSFRPGGFSLDRPACCPAKNAPYFAAVAEGGGVALAKSVQGDFTFLFFSMEGYLAHAERLYEAGKTADAEAVYASLERSEKDAGVLFAARAHHAAQLRKKGRVPEAQALLAGISGTAATSGTQGAALAAVLRGQMACFELRDFDKARQLFLNAGRKPLPPAAPGASPDAMPADGDAVRTAVEAPQRGALAVLQTHNAGLIRAWADAHTALRAGNVAGSLEAAQRLVPQYGNNPVVIDAMLDLLENPCQSEHLCRPGNPFDRPENESRVLEILTALEKSTRPSLRRKMGLGIPFMEEAPSRESNASRARLREELLQRLVKARRFEEAADVALGLLQESGPEALGIGESLQYYLESERSDPYAANLVSRVLLSPRIVPLLQNALKPNVSALCMLELARIKKALTDNDTEGARLLLASTQQMFHSLPAEAFSREVARLQVHLYLFAGKRFEMLSEWTKAAEKYSYARDVLLKYWPENTKFYYLTGEALEEIRLGRALPKLLADYQAALRAMGDAVLNPATQPAQLHAGVKSLIELHRTASGTPLDALFFYQIGLSLGRAESTHAAAYYLDRALGARPPAALRAAILLEKANVMENMQDWWRQRQTLAELVECTPNPAQQDVIRLKSVQPLLRLGNAAEARALLQTLSAHATQPSLRQNAKQQLEIFRFQ